LSCEPSPHSKGMRPDSSKYEQWTGYVRTALHRPALDAIFARPPMIQDSLPFERRFSQSVALAFS
jgi:hypothetical protein